MTRVYVPATAADLRVLDEGGSLRPEAAYAAGPELMATDASVSEEEWEYHVTYEAAEASMRRGRAGDRRIVVVAETRAPVHGVVGDPARVEGVGPIALTQVEAFLVDVPDASGVIDTDDDLAWFATQELATLIAPAT